MLSQTLIFQALELESQWVAAALSGRPGIERTVVPHTDPAAYTAPPSRAAAPRPYTSDHERSTAYPPRAPPTCVPVCGGGGGGVGTRLTSTESKPTMAAAVETRETWQIRRTKPTNGGATASPALLLHTATAWRFVEPRTAAAWSSG